MPHSQTYEAIILKTYDVGEADRFCILLTRERGRLAARARGVRKLKSRMGGSLLPFHHVTLDLVEGSAGFLITSVKQHIHDCHVSDIASFLSAEQGVEMLLTLLHDEEPQESIFNLTLEFLDHCQNPSPDPILPFTVRLLYLLGMLPHSGKAALFSHLSEEERSFIDACLNKEWKEPPPSGTRHINALCTRLLETQSSRSLKASKVASSMRR